MFLLAFHAFLRIGEITVHSRNKSDLVVQLDVSISNTGSLLVMSQFKHNTSGHPVTLSILPTKDRYCPVNSLSQLLKVRGPAKGSLFAFTNASPVSRNFFFQYLSKALQWAGLDRSKYKAHSFRIGAATKAADMGMSEAQIQSMGRWKSIAFQRYIRIPMLRMNSPWCAAFSCNCFVLYGVDDAAWLAFILYIVMLVSCHCGMLSRVLWSMTGLTLAPSSS